MSNVGRPAASDGLVEFARLVNSVSLYEALPHRPLVVHADPSIPLVDALAAFLPCENSRGVEIVEVLGQGSQRLTRLDLFRWLQLRSEENFREISVQQWLERRPDEAVSEFVSLDLLTSREREIPLSHAVKILLGAGNFSEEFPIPVFARTDSRLNAVFGYVTAEQLLAAAIGNFSSPVSEHPQATVADGTAAGNFPALLSTEGSACSLGQVVQAMAESRKFLAFLVDEAGNFRSAVSGESAVAALAAGRRLETPVTPGESEILSANVEILFESEFPLSVRDLSRRVLLSEGVVVVSENSQFPIAVFRAVDLWRLLSANFCKFNF